MEVTPEQELEARLRLIVMCEELKVPLPKSAMEMTPEEIDFVISELKQRLDEEEKKKAAPRRKFDWILLVVLLVLAAVLFFWRR